LQARKRFSAAVATSREGRHRQKKPAEKNKSQAAGDFPSSGMRCGFDHRPTAEGESADDCALNSTATACLVAGTLQGTKDGQNLAPFQFSTSKTAN
jgi:hypothetical protein